MAALLLDLQPGDEVIVPSFTFVSTANAFALRGARPVFADIRPDTQNLDEGRLERLVTPRTRAIVPVHYGGIGCEMDAIGEIAQRHGLAVVEDNAHGLFGTYRGRSLGTLGCLGAQSFHETKNFTCGEGGALLINDLRLASRAEIVREKGTNRSRFLRGEVDKYTWVDLGSSYLPSDLLAAFLYAQLEARETIQSARRRVWTFYHERLRGWAEDHRVRLPSAPPHCGPSYHLFYLILPTPERRQELGDYLRARGIQAVSHYPPLHLSGMGQRFGGKSGDCPVTEEVCPRLIRLPFYAGLTDSDLACVTDAIHEFH
jgi:dTDP-4-amino-4,6-dideoxygalactose transaminase